MDRSDGIRDAIAGILSITLLRIMNSIDDDDQVRIMAYHAHNLPTLLLNLNDDLVSYYLDVERPQFIRESLDRNFSVYEPHWQTLDRLTKA